MNSNTFIVPYKKGSESCKILSEAMGIRRLKREGDVWNRSGKIVINWGCSSLPSRINTTGNAIINSESAVTIASDKLLTFKRLKVEGVRTVPWTEDVHIAGSWMEGEGDVVYSRTSLNSHSGGGIILNKFDSDNPDYGIAEAPLYTKWLNSRAEYRVHVSFGDVIDVRRKAKKEGVEGNRYIRSHSNGYVFKQHNEDVPYDVREVAKESVLALGLDFGAVDVLYYRDEAYIIEVNTACGLEGSTIARYVESFEGLG